MRRTDENALKSVQAAVHACLPPTAAGEQPWTVWRRAQGDVKVPFAVVSSIAAPDLSTDDLQTPKVTMPVNVAIYLAPRATAGEADDAARVVRDRLTEAFVFGAGQPGPRRVRFYDWGDRLYVERVKVLAGAEVPAAALVTVAGETLTLPLPLTPDGEAAATVVLRALLGDDAEVRRRTGLAFDLVLPGSQQVLVEAGGTPVEQRVILTATPAPWRGDRDVLSIADFGAQIVADQDRPQQTMVMADLRCTFRRGVQVPSSQTYVRRVGARFDPME